MHTHSEFFPLVDHRSSRKSRCSSWQALLAAMQCNASQFNSIQFNSIHSSILVGCGGFDSLVLGAQNLLGPALDHLADLWISNHAHDGVLHGGVQWWLRQGNRVCHRRRDGALEGIRGQTNHNRQEGLLDGKRRDEPGPEFDNLGVAHCGRIQGHLGAVASCRRASEGEDKPI